VKRFVFWAGIYDLAVGIGFFFPGLAPRLGVQQPESLFLSWSPALLTTFLGVMLILLAIGSTYLVGLPRALHRSHMDLLLDRAAAAGF
jgi:hypothetical protein